MQQYTERTAFNLKHLSLIITRSSPEGVCIADRTDRLRPYVLQCNILSEIRYFRFFYALFVTTDAVPLSVMHPAFLPTPNAALWMCSILCSLDKAATSNHLHAFCTFPFFLTSWLYKYYCFRLFLGTWVEKRKENLSYEKALTPCL